MSESLKTILFATVAIVAVVIAVVTYPKQEDYQPPQLAGKPLFPDFTDSSVAGKLKITRFNEDIGALSEFEVARDAKTGLWSIPSSSNYPADAEAQMRDAATSLIDLNVLGIASEENKEHQTFGVIEPNKQKLDASQAGVGLLVQFEDTKSKDLASLIIGKRVKGTQDQYFVRKPAESSVCVVKIDPSKFPTEFDKWIEPDLLKINTLDVDRVLLKDYSIIPVQTPQGPRGQLDERFEALVTFASDQNKWAMTDFIETRNGERKPAQLLPTEELNNQKMNDLKSALDNLKIVGVLRKPTGLGADLKAGKEFLDNRDSLSSLINRGFYPDPNESGDPEIRAANGEVIVGLKDGVEYVLRFGETADIAAQVGQEGEDTQINRYLFVTVRRDESKFPPLQLEPLPGGEEAVEAPKEEAKDPAAAEQPKEGAVEEKKPEEKKPEEQTDLELARERVRKENQRKQDERDEKLKKANQQIAELNARFADWYYIISEDGYQKIRLRRNDLIAEKASATEEGFGVDSLRQLEQEGIETKKEPADGAPPMQPPAMPMGIPQ